MMGLRAVLSLATLYILHSTVIADSSNSDNKKETVLVLGSAGISALALMRQCHKTKSMTVTPLQVS